MNEPTKTVSWSADEYLHHEKDTLWYIGFVIVAIALIVYAIFSRSILTIITFVLIAILGFIFSHRKPQRLVHKLTPNGIQIGDMMYPYRNIKKFWLIYDPPQVKTLNLETTGYLNSHVAIQLGEQDPVEVKMFLKDYLKEDLNHDESFTDIISRKLKI